MKIAPIIFFCVPIVGARGARSQEVTQSSAAHADAVARPASTAPTAQPPPPPLQPPPLPYRVGEAAKPEMLEAQESESEEQWVYTLGTVTVILPTPTQQPTRIGQWVYTEQYGWLYMPYGDQYISKGTDDDGNSYGYAYQPGYGWMWLSAPWILEEGPSPYFGVLGPDEYTWLRGRYGRSVYWGQDVYRHQPSPYDLDYAYFGSPGGGVSPGGHGPRSWGSYAGSRGRQHSDLVVGEPRRSTTGHLRRSGGPHDGRGGGPSASLVISSGHRGSRAKPAGLAGSGASRPSPHGGSHTGGGYGSRGSRGGGIVRQGHRGGGALAGHRR